MTAAAVAELAVELRERAAIFVELLDELAAVADELADLDLRLVAARNRAGAGVPGGLCARSLAAEAIRGYLVALQPHLGPPTSREAGRRAAERLTAP